jgi:hypothetical protein
VRERMEEAEMTDLQQNFQVLDVINEFWSGESEGERGKNVGSTAAGRKELERK